MMLVVMVGVVVVVYDTRAVVVISVVMVGLMIGLVEMV